MRLRLTGNQQELLRQLLEQQHDHLLTPEQLEKLDSIRAARTADLESYTPGPDLKIRVTSLPDGGTEFYFPPAPFDTNAAGNTLLLLIMVSVLSAVRGLLFNSDYTNHSGEWLAMTFFVVLAILTLLVFLRVLRLWFAPERATIANGVLSDTTGIFRRTRTMPVAEIAAIHATQGSTQNHCAIFIRGFGLHRLTVGDGIREWRDADWLAMQMSRAVGIKASASLGGEAYDEQAKMLQTFVEDFSARYGDKIQSSDRR